MCSQGKSAPSAWAKTQDVAEPGNYPKILHLCMMGMENQFNDLLIPANSSSSESDPTFPCIFVHRWKMAPLCCWSGSAPTLLKAMAVLVCLTSTPCSGKAFTCYGAFPGSGTPGHCCFLINPFSLEHARDGNLHQILLVSYCQEKQEVKMQNEQKIT